MSTYDQRGQSVGVQQNADVVTNVYAAPTSGLSTHDLDNRRRMLARMANDVDQQLKTSLHGAAWMRLAFERCPPDTTGGRSHVPSALVGDTPVEPPGDRVVETFDACDGELLILGAPGAGKTTTLLSLASELIARAGHDVTMPIPMVFNLASWGRGSTTLADWLVGELVSVYDMSVDIARDWIKNDDVLPLLDGLDEVSVERRGVCVEAINTFRARHSKRLNRIAVCCRLAAYEDLPRLKLRGAIVVRALAVSQVDAYLAEVGDRVAGLRAALLDDPILLEMATTPLLLNLMILTYQGSDAPSLPTARSAEDRRAQLLTAYVVQMFRRRPPDPRFPAHQTVHWLTWLAGALDRRSQVTFYLEHLQPNWLPTARARRQYALVDRLGWGAVLGLGFGLSLGLVYWWIFGEKLGLLTSVCAAVAIGLGSAESAGLFGGTRERRVTLRRSQLRRDLAHLGSIGLGMLIGGVNVLLFVLIDQLTSGGLGPSFIWLVVLGTVPQMGVLSVLTGGPGFLPRRIIPVDNVGWSPLTAARAAMAGLGIGVIAGLGIVATYTIAKEPTAVMSRLFTSELWWGGLILGPMIAVYFGVMGGFTRDQVVLRGSPNQGVRRSVRRSFLFGLAMLGLITVSMIFVFPRLGESESPLAIISDLALRAGLSFALPFALVHGGYTGLSHAALRLILWRHGAVPLNYVAFLDYATECIFLRRVGGGYMFVHRLVQEHFARHERDLLSVVQAPLEATRHAHCGLAAGSS